MDVTAVPQYSDLLRTDGKVFVIVGAGQGIGRQVAHGLAQGGATVVCVGRGKEATEHVAKEVGGLAILADAQNRDDVERLFAEVKQRYGRLDGILDTVAIGVAGGILNLTDADYQWSHDNVLRHAFLLLQLGAPLMRDSGGGSVVLVSSVAAQRGFPGSPLAYSMFKAALEHLGRMSAMELGPLGIRVNTVSPGFIKTPRWQGYPEEFYAEAYDKYPLRRIGVPEEVASTILFLLSDMARNVTGTVLQVDGGYSIMSPPPVSTNAKMKTKDDYHSE